MGVALALVVLLFARPWDSGNDGGSGDRTPNGGSTAAVDRSPTTTDPGQGSTPPGTATSGTDTKAGPDNSPSASVPIQAITATDPSGQCRATIERLKQYRTAAQNSTVSELYWLFDKMSDFEGETFTLGATQPWADRVSQELTAVRRDWASAASADGEGDKAGARGHADSALKRLDTVISTTACPG